MKKIVFLCFGEGARSGQTVSTLLKASPCCWAGVRVFLRDKLAIDSEEV